MTQTSRRRKLDIKLPDPSLLTCNFVHIDATPQKLGILTYNLEKSPPESISTKTKIILSGIGLHGEKRAIQLTARYSF